MVFFFRTSTKLSQSRYGMLKIQTKLTLNRERERERERGERYWLVWQFLHFVLFSCFSFK